MHENPVLRRLRAGQQSIGTFVFEFATTGIGRITAAAGAEFVVLDMEHSGFDVERVRTVIATMRSSEIVPIVRVPATECHFLARVLDVGAMGVMVPMVESVEQAQRIADATRYPPRGRRGSGFGISHDDYRGGDIVEKQASADRERLVIAQIETATGVEHADAIAAVDGIDVLWVGQTDLTTSLGIPGQFEHPKFEHALDCVLEAAQRHRKAAGFMAMSVEEGGELLARGFRALAFGGDIWLYQHALGAGIAALRDGAPNR